ncbi:MAG: prepilin-type N-terminal cleavage/methylation domain-containing protein [Candidatus Falkowbacteria bacterium]|nr:prepilin-type N-terminal cleavage/methylation domain-containing protein [Candidatus Falkowbacteria bacterium]
MSKNYKTGFTLIELLVVIAIIGVLSTMAIIALGNARAKARDSRRVADIKQISTALELYYADNNSYPTIITPGNSLTSPDGTKVYMASIPNNPTPRNDNGCGNNNYTYASTPDNTNYSLNFCLGNNVSSTPAGINSSSSTGVGTAPGLVGWWKFDEGSGTTAIDSSGNNITGSWIGTAPYYTTAKIGTYAGKFNGTDSYVSVPANNNLIINSGSISMWFYFSAPGNNSRLVDIGNAAASERIGFFIGTTNLYLYGVKSSSAVLNINTAPLTLNSWYYVVGTWDSAGGNIYIKNATTNNTISSSGDKTMTLPLGTTKLFIGNFIAGGTTYLLNGGVDDVRIYNRVLSSSEVNAIYEATK